MVCQSTYLMRNGNTEGLISGTMWVNARPRHTLNLIIIYKSYANILIRVLEKITSEQNWSIPVLRGTELVSGSTETFQPLVKIATSLKKKKETLLSKHFYCVMYPVLFLPRISGIWYIGSQCVLGHKGWFWIRITQGGFNESFTRVDAGNKKSVLWPERDSKTWHLAKANTARCLSLSSSPPLWHLYRACTQLMAPPFLPCVTLHSICQKEMAQVISPGLMHNFTSSKSFLKRLVCSWLVQRWEADKHFTIEETSL